MANDVLLVDADPSALGLMTQSLSQKGLQVYSVGKPQEALERISKAIPSLVISDADPDGADGLSLLKKLRANPKTAQVPFLLLSNSDWAGRQKEAKRLGAQDLLRKPLFAQDIAVLGQLYAGQVASQETFVGDLDGVGCPRLLRGLLAGGRTGQISFDPAGGRIYFQEGQIIDAVLPPRSGERALLRMLTFERGRYRLRFEAVNRRQTLSVGLPELTGRGVEYVRQWAEVSSELGPPDAVLEVDFQRLSGELAEVPQEVWPLIRLFDGRRSVLEVVDSFGSDDLSGARALLQLRAMGLLNPVTARAADPKTEAFFRGEAPEPAALAAATRATAARNAPIQLVTEVAGAAPATPDLEAAFFAAQANGDFSAKVPSKGIWPLLQRGAILLAACAAAVAVVVKVTQTAAPTSAAKPAGISAPIRVPSMAGIPASPGADGQTTAMLSQGQEAFDHGDFVSAEDVFDQVVQLHPNNVTAQLYLGLSRYEQGKLAKAIGPFEAARTLDPKNARAAVLAGAVYQELGKAPLARERYEEYLKLQPKGENADEVRVILSNLGSDISG